jgi:hypothetical protein
MVKQYISDPERTIEVPEGTLVSINDYNALRAELTKLRTDTQGVVEALNDHAQSLQDTINFLRDRLAKERERAEKAEAQLVSARERIAGGRKMTKYRKKPVVVEAVQFTGDSFLISDFAGGLDGPAFLANGRLYLHTLEGAIEVSINDWVIKGIKGEFYPCKPDIFMATYDEVEE